MNVIKQAKQAGHTLGQETFSNLYSETPDTVSEQTAHDTLAAQFDTANKNMMVAFAQGYKEGVKAAKAAMDAFCEQDTQAVFDSMDAIERYEARRRDPEYYDHEAESRFWESREIGYGI